MPVVDVVILAAWVAFWIYWLTAAIGVKAGQTSWTRFAGVRVAAQSTKMLIPFII